MSGGCVERATVHWLIQTAADVAPGNEWLTPAERDVLASLRVPKRRDEWRLGRWTAKRALATVMAADGSAPLAVATLEIATDAQGAPRASYAGQFVPYCLSISHSHGRAVCAVAAANVAIGCDLERVEPRSAAFAREWFTASEQDAIAAVEAGARDLAVTLFWSAKESALKAIGIGLTVSTDDVPVSIVAPQSDRDWNPLFVSPPAAAHAMTGWWRTDAGDLITIVTTARSGEPAALFS